MDAAVRRQRRPLHLGALERPQQQVERAADDERARLVGVALHALGHHERRRQRALGVAAVAVGHHALDERRARQVAELPRVLVDAVGRRLGRRALLRLRLVALARPLLRPPLRQLAAQILEAPLLRLRRLRDRPLLCGAAAAARRRVGGRDRVRAAEPNFRLLCSGSSLEAWSRSSPRNVKMRSESGTNPRGAGPRAHDKRGGVARDAVGGARPEFAEIALDVCSPSSQPTDVASLRHLFSRLGLEKFASDALSHFQKQPACIPLLIALIHEDLAAAAPGSPLPSSLLLASQMLHKALRRSPLADCDGVEAQLVPALRAVAARVWSPALTALALSVAVLLIRGAPWPGVLAHLDGDGDAADREVVLSILTVVAEEVTSPSSRISAAPASVSGLKQAMRADGGALLRRVHAWCIGETAERRRVAAGLACCRAWCAAEMILEGEAPLDEALLLVELGARTLGDEALAPHAADLLCTLLPLLGGGADAAVAADGGGGGGAAAAADGSPSRGRAPQAPRRTVLDAARGACLLPALEPLLPACSRCRRPPRATLPSSLATRAPLGARLAPAGGADPLGAARLSDALKRWLELLLRAAAALPAADASVALDGWVGVQEIAAEAPTEAGRRAVSAALAPLLGTMLETVLRLTTVPDGFLDALTAADRDDFALLREDMRNLLRASLHGAGEVATAARRLHDLIASHLPPDDGAPPPEGSWVAVEVALHAASALAKPLGAQPCAPLSAMMTEQVPRAFALARRLLEATPPHPFGRPLLCTALIFVSAYASWLGGLGPFGRPPLERCAEVQAVLPMLIYSLSVAEDDPDPRGAWPLRSKQEHAGCVALSKMCPPRSGAADALLAVAPLPEPAARSSTPSARGRARSRSARLPLPGAASQPRARAWIRCAPTRPPPRWRRASSALLRRRLAVRRGGGGGGGGAARRLAEPVSSPQRAAQPARRARRRARRRRRLIARCVCAAAGRRRRRRRRRGVRGAAALFDGCGAAAALLLASIPPTLQPPPVAAAALGRSPPAVAVVRAAVVGVAGRCGADSDADAQLGALVAHVGGALATGGRSDDAAAHAAQQALWAEWFELYAEVAAARRTTEAREETRSMAAAPPHQKYAATNGGGGEPDGGVVDAVTAVVVGAMPSLLGCVWAALRSPPPPDLYDDADGVIGLKTALVMLAQLKPTHATPAGATVRGPLGDALRGALDAPAPRRRRAAAARARAG